MFCSEAANSQIHKIHKRPLHLIYEMEDASFEVLQISVHH